MVEDVVELPVDSTLNIEGKRNVPLCPMCTEELQEPDANFPRKRDNPDTRWLYCTDCGCHLGYHRMRGAWKVTPEDLDSNEKVREYFGLGPVVEE